MLELKHITKQFPGVLALDDVSIDFYEGEIHALLGENGAGKSTLIKVISGIHAADEGKVVLDGKTLHMKSFHDAIKNGISIVNQELNLISYSSIAENIMMDKLEQFEHKGFLSWKEINESARKYMKMVKLDLDPSIPVEHLSAAQKQLIQIAKALSAEAKVLLLDEPTSSLTNYETQLLFDILRGLKKHGVIQIFVSHKIEEVQEISDKATVLRDGRHVGTDLIKNLTKQAIIKMMIGRESTYEYRGRLDAENNEVALDVQHLYAGNSDLEDMSFQVRKGEILGFYGLVGSGRTELARAVLGIDRKDAGNVYIGGRKADIHSMNDSLYKYRMGYVTENRKEEGLFLNDSVKTNICITSWDKMLSKLHLISLKTEIKDAQRMVDTLEIKAPGLNSVANSLSGGNQQKVCISKWLLADCDILIIDEPTVGVDVGAKEYIHDLIWSLAAEQKMAIVLISSDMNEIVSLARRILIFKEKKIVGELEGEELFTLSSKEVSERIGDYFT